MLYERGQITERFGPNNRAIWAKQHDDLGQTTERFGPFRQTIDLQPSNYAAISSNYNLHDNAERRFATR